MNFSCNRPRFSGRAYIVILLGLVMLAEALVLSGCGTISMPTPSSTVQINPSDDALTTAPEEIIPPETEPIPSTTVETTPPGPYVEATASIGVTGDIMGHLPVINAGKTETGYDFSRIYTHISAYYQSYDYMVANLEVNLGGTESGPYQGYPTFNSPDEMATALRDAGVDMVLTANNHTYDIGHKSFLRTQSALRQMGLAYLGTRMEAEAPEYMLQEINGIKVGMVCYTYETGKPSDPQKQLNGINLSIADSALVSSFNYRDLDTFYSELSVTLEQMYADGAEATMVYLHWGDEYALRPNTKQQEIAQNLCELGVDVIVGGHPHVVQPFEMLTSSTGHHTYCIYSVGNAISNQRVETLSNTTSAAQYTEDGMIFHVVFEKWNDGSVKVGQINIIPTWVNKTIENERYIYEIIPLDTASDAWNRDNAMLLSDCYASDARTMSIVGEGLNECRDTLALAPVPLKAD